MSSGDKIGAQHRARKAVLCVRQSSALQVQYNRESQVLQYAIRENVATKVDIAAARAAVEQARIALNARIDLVERRLVIRGAALLAVAWLGASYERQPCA
jgi:hypothetical protein